MKKLIFAPFIMLVMIGACKKETASTNADTPRTTVPASLQGSWMYGQFSMTEYWSQDPEEYLGNGFEMSIAFKFNADGSFEQYFTSSYVSGTVVTYMQSVTKGSVEIDEATKTITTHATSAHFRQTANGQIVEERDLRQSELTAEIVYSYDFGTENGQDALYLLMEGTEDSIPFIKKF